MTSRSFSDLRRRCRRAIVPALLAGVFLAACGEETADDAVPSGEVLDEGADRVPPPAPADTVTIEEALAERTDAWMAIDGVEGTGIGLCDGVPCITVFVSRPPEAFAGTLPDSVDGHPVRLEPTGQFEAQ